MRAKTFCLAATAAVLLGSGVASADIQTLDRIVPQVRETYQPSQNMAPIFSAYRRSVAERCEGHEDVMEVYDRLVAAIGRDGGFEPNNARYWPLLHSAIFAAEKHMGQTRKGPAKTPYIVHPIGVTLILWEEGEVRDLDVLMASMLHDTVEDTDTSFEELEGVFWPGVVSLVKEVTDDKSLPRSEQKAQQIVGMPFKSRGAQQIKLADKIYNLRDLRTAHVTGMDTLGYVAFSEQVGAGCEGANPDLELALRRVAAEHRGICLMN